MIDVVLFVVDLDVELVEFLGIIVELVVDVMVDEDMDYDCFVVL